MLTTEQKLLATIAHLAVFFGFPILAPLVIMLLSDDFFVKVQAKEALVFQGTLIIAGFISTILVIILIGFLLLKLVVLLSWITALIATIKIWQDQDYSYPITGKWARNL